MTTGDSTTTRLDTPNITVTGSTDYILSFWVKTTAITGNSTEAFLIRDVTHSTNFVAWQDTGIGNTNWTQYTYRFTTPADCASILMRFYVDDTATNIVYLDDISLIAADTPGADTYIDCDSGLDTNTGASSGTAWKTIGRASFSNFSAGSNIYLKKGCTFSGQKLIVTSSGSSGNAINYSTYGSGSNPIIQQDLDYAGYVSGKNYIVVDGIDFKGPATRGAADKNLFQISNASDHITVKNGTISYGKASGIRADIGTTNITFENLIATMNRSTGIYMSAATGTVRGTSLGLCKSYLNGSMVGDTGDMGGIGVQGADITIENCEVYGNGPSGAFSDAEIAIARQAAGPNVGKITIRKNYIHGADHGGIAFYGGGFSNSEIYDNVIKDYGVYSNGSQGILISASDVNTDGVKIYNNTIYGGTITNYYKGAAIRIQRAGSYTLTGLRVKNNIIANNASSAISVQNGPISTDWEFSNNIYYRSSLTDNWDWHDSLLDTLGDWQATINFSIKDTSSLSSDPQFVSASNFHLQNTSPAINAGANSVWSGTANITDYEGNPITNGSGTVVASGGTVDIGAYEFQDTAAPTGGSFTINNNALYTTSAPVTLNITCPTDSWPTVQVAYGNTVNPANWATCVSGDIAHTLIVGDGLKTVYVRFKDGGNNTTTDYTHTITLDSTPPVITITNPNSTPAQSKTITASATESATKYYHINDFGDDTCAGTLSFTDYTSLTFNSESDNGKKVCYKAVDAINNTSYLLSDAISGIDLAPPDTTINTHPNSNSNSAIGSFTFSSSEPTNATFECSYNNQDYLSCTSPVNYDFTDGTRTFYVRAIDQAGNTDASSSSFTWMIDTEAPALQNLQPDSQIFPVATTSQTLTLDTTETSICKYSTTSGTDYSSMIEFENTDDTSHSSLITGLNSGTTYRYYLKCQDIAGNQSGESSLSFSIAPEEHKISLNSVKVKIERTWNKFKDNIHSKKKKLKLKSEDSQLGNGQVKIYSDGKRIETIDINSSGAWDYLLKLKDDASKTIKLKFFDSYGSLLGTEKAKVEVDTEDPDFTLFPSENKTVYANYQRDENRALIYQATDNEKIEKYKIEFNGKITDKKPASADRDKVQSYLVPKDTPAGSYQFKATAYDLSGNRTEKETRIIVRASSSVSTANANYSQYDQVQNQVQGASESNIGNDNEKNNNNDINPDSFSNQSETKESTPTGGFRWWNPSTWF